MDNNQFRQGQGFKVKNFKRLSPQRTRSVVDEQSQPENSIAMEEVDGFNIVRVKGILGWKAFKIISAVIYKSYKANIRRVRIDLSECTAAYQDGIIPLISLINKYKSDGLAFKFLWPSDHKLKAVFVYHNWAHMLDKSEKKMHKPLTRTTGAVEFDSSENLNDMINKAIGVAMKSSVFAPGTLNSLEWALYEITDNVLRHSGLSKGWFEMTWGVAGIISFTVCDCGVGIPKHMKAAFKEIKSDHESLAYAVEKGVTSNSREGQGNGLAGTLAIVHAGGGELFIYSLNGALKYDQSGLSYKPDNIPYPGTFVSFSIPDSNGIDLKKALWGFEELGYAQLKYDMNDDNAVVIKLKEEEKGFGNRQTGFKIRTLLINLIQNVDGRKVILDFYGIDVISSSFADEVFGKFVWEFGFVNFSQTIGIRNSTPFLDNLINNVVMQRMAQIYAEGRKVIPLIDQD